VADVEVEVQLAVVHPPRVVEAQRHLDQPPPERLQEVDP
jgi:hypothetical protein